MKFGGKHFGELKSICIENVMEIMKIGYKTWRNAVIHQTHRNFFIANVFLLYSKCSYTAIFLCCRRKTAMALSLKNSTQFIIYTILPLLMEQYVTRFAKRCLIYIHTSNSSTSRTYNAACVLSTALIFGSMTFLSSHIYDRNFWLNSAVTSEVMLLQSCKIECMYKRPYHKSTHM